MLDYKELLEEAKKDKIKFSALKNLAIKFGKYEEAARLRDFETEQFPEPKEVKDAKNDLVDWNLLFRMMGINADEKTTWLICTALKKHSLDKENFSLKDAQQIRDQSDRIFSE